MRLVVRPLDAQGDALDAWSPFRETRPLADLLFGTRTLGERLERALGASGRRPAEGESAARPALIDPRFIPEGPLGLEALNGIDPSSPGGVRLAVGRHTVGWILPSRVDPDATPVLPSGDAVSTLELPGSFLASPWELMARNADQVSRDLLDDPPSDAHPLDPLPPGVTVLGSYPVTAAPGVAEVVDPFVVLDARRGPIHLAAGAELRSHTRLEGPAWIGPGTRLLGGVFSALSAGPVCRLRGEIEASVVNGWCNKAHDGYLGHAVLGRWVNLGALTTNSDLKNTYGPVRVHLDAQRTVDTGQIKVGILLGDHVKTGIGTLLNTGTVVGAGSNLFGGGALPPRWVPPFSWGGGSELGVYRLDAFLEVAERAMARREQVLGPREREALVALWQATHGASGSGRAGEPSRPGDGTRAG